MDFESIIRVALFAILKIKYIGCEGFTLMGTRRSVITLQFFLELIALSATVIRNWETYIRKLMQQQLVRMEV